MVLCVNINEECLVAPKSRSWIAGYYHLLDHLTETNHPYLNGEILVEYKALQHVVSSATEEEVAGIFHNAQIKIPIRIILATI